MNLSRGILNLGIKLDLRPRTAWVWGCRMIGIVGPTTYHVCVELDPWDWDLMVSVS